MQVFALAAECAMERSRLVPVEEALDLWALAASLQVHYPEGCSIALTPAFCDCLVVALSLPATCTL